MAHEPDPCQREHGFEGKVVNDIRQTKQTDPDPHMRPFLGGTPQEMPIPHPWMNLFLKAWNQFTSLPHRSPSSLKE
jgi:hypothetical protein